MASALEHAHPHSTFQGADVYQQGTAAVAQVELSPPRGVRLGSHDDPKKHLLSFVAHHDGHNCGPVLGSGGNNGSYLFGEVLRRQIHYRRVSMVSGRPPLLKCCTVTGVGPFSLVGRT